MSKSDKKSEKKSDKYDARGRGAAAGAAGTDGADGSDAEDTRELIILEDDEGNQLEFEFLDMIAYGGKNYAVLVDTDESEDQVVIFRVENADSENNSFLPVTDQELAMAVFTLFKEKNSDLYDFYE